MRRTYNSLPQMIVFGAIAFAGIATRGQLPSAAPSWADWLFIAITALLLVWCIHERAASIDAKGHEQTRQGYAFRLGKALNRVRRRVHR